MDAELITQGTLQTRAGRALPLQRTEVRATVTGPVAEVEVRQVFRNDTDTAIEAVYLFPLPHDASVHRMLFRIEDRVVQGVVKDKAEARRTYEKARAEGRAATLLEEEKPALFTLSVANVAPGATIEVELGYQELVAYDDGRWRFVFPLVAPERYRDPPPAAAGALAPPRMPTGQRAGDVSLEVLVRGEGHVESLRSPTHPVTARYTDDGVPVVSMLPGDTLPNRDFVLTWQAGDTGVRPALRFERHPGQTGTFLLVVTPSVPKDLTERTGGAGDLKALKCGNCGGAVTDLASIREIPGLGPVVPCGYCGAILSPGTEVVTRARRPRDVLVLVDRSASMRATLPTVRRAVRALLDALAPGDGAQLMAFDHDRVAFDHDGSRFAVVSPELITQAERFLSELRPRGGTELEAALARAAALPPRDGRTRVVVAITNAAVGNTGRLLRRVPELLGPSTRLFVLGAGPAVDRRLVAALARAGGGASDVIDPGARGDDLEETLRRFARRVREGGPVLTNLTLYWQGATMVDVYPKALPDLFGGEPLRVLGRFDAAGPTKLILTAATSDGRPFRQELDVVLPAHTPTAPGLGRLWARRHVEALAARADAEPSVAAALREEATALLIAHRIVGPFTSLVAEDLVVSVKPRAVRKGVLQVVAGPVVAPPFVLDRPHVRVGRVSTADLQLNDPTVSREHCEVVLEGDDWIVRDAHSANGIEVDGKMVRRAVLQPGSRVVLGGCTLRFDRLDDTFGVAPAQRVDVEGPATAAVDTGAAPQADGPGKGRAVAEASAAFADDEADFDLHAMLGEGGGDFLGLRDGTEASASSAPEARKRASTTGAPPPPAAFDAPPPAPRPAPVPMFAPAPMAAPGGPPPSAPGMPTSAPMSAPLGSAAPVSGMFGAMPPALAPIPAPAEAGGGFFSRVAQSLRGARSEEAPSPPSPPPVVPPPILWPIDPLAPPPTPFVPPLRCCTSCQCPSRCPRPVRRRARPNLWLCPRARGVPRSWRPTCASACAAATTCGGACRFLRRFRSRPWRHRTGRSCRPPTRTTPQSSRGLPRGAAASSTSSSSSMRRARWAPTSTRCVRTCSRW